jgi:hypothetical protein
LELTVLPIGEPVGPCHLLDFSHKSNPVLSPQTQAFVAEVKMVTGTYWFSNGEYRKFQAKAGGYKLPMKRHSSAIDIFCCWKRNER